jgi:small multidrug resistance pump
MTLPPGPRVPAEITGRPARLLERAPPGGNRCAQASPHSRQQPERSPSFLLIWALRFLVGVVPVPWLFLVGAILTEVAATTALKLSEGFTRVAPSIVVVIGYTTAFGMLSQALSRGMGIGVAYGVWAAAGVALVAIIGAVFLGESMTWVQVAGIALVIAGVLALELGAHHPQAQQ